MPTSGFPTQLWGSKLCAAVDRRLGARYVGLDGEPDRFGCVRLVRDVLSEVVGIDLPDPVADSASFRRLFVRVGTDLSEAQPLDIITCDGNDERHFALVEDSDTAVDVQAASHGVKRNKLWSFSDARPTLYRLQLP